jgi:hypothetical protein
MVPLGMIAAEPLTINAMETGVLTTIELLAGDTVTVGVVFEGRPPLPLLPLPPLLPGEDDDPQPIAAEPTASTSVQTDKILRHFRWSPGTKKINKARSTDPPATLNHFESLKRARRRPPEVTAVVLIDTVVVPVVTVELSETAELAAEHVGRLVAPTGEEVSAQVKVTVPVYPLLPLTVTVDVAGAPAAVAAGLVADSVKVGGTTAITTIVVVPVAGA